MIFLYQFLNSLIGIEFKGHVPSQVNQFIGRNKDIQNILQHLQSNQLVLITGSPGIGKTGLAIEVAHRLRENNSSSIIDFINLRSIHSVETIISTILLAFSKTADDKPIEMLQNVLNSIKSEVVLIFDNTEDALTDNLKDKFLNAMKELLLKSTNLKLLCTSRVKFYLLGINCKEEVLQALEAENALSVIRTVLPDMCDEDARKLMDVCGCAPLALWIVTNLIKDGGYSPESVIKEISLNAAKPMEGYYLEYLPENCQLEVCINSSYVRLSTEMQNAFCCLSIFPSTFDADAAKAIIDVPNTERTLAGLKIRSFLSYDPATNLYSLHPYMRAFAKSCKEYDHQSTKLRFEMYYMEKLLALTNVYFSKDFIVAVREIRKEQANITEMLTLITKDKELYKTYRQLASILISRFIYMFISVECYVSFYTELVETATEKKDTRTQALAYFCLAYHHRYIEKFEKAIDMFMVAVSKYGRWGPDKFFIPTCHSNIAYCHCKLDNKEEATKHVTKSKKFLSQRKDGKQNLSLAILLSATASPLRRIAWFDESTKVGLAALQILEDVLGDHLDTARELHNLGVCLPRHAQTKDRKDKQRLSLLEESLKYSVRAGKIYENVIGNNSETAESMFLSGQLSFKLQKFQQSSDFFKKSLEINEELYGLESEKVTKAKYIKDMADNSLAIENLRLKSGNKT